MRKSITERVQDLHDRRRKAQVCRKQRKTDKPHGAIFKYHMCQPCYADVLAYNKAWKRKQRKKQGGG